MTNLLIRLFIKDNKDVTNFRVRTRYGIFTGIVGIASNILLFVIKIVSGLLVNSISIIADAINNLADSGSSVITLLGFKISGKPADEKHPYGHARMEYISGLIVSFVIMFLGFQLIQNSIKKILHPELAHFSIASVVILSIAILIKLWQCLFYRKISAIINSTALKATSIDSRNDIFSTLAVLAAMIITNITGFNLDGYMGCVVALFIIITGFKLVNETISPLLGTAPTKDLVEKIFKKILSYEGIIGLHDLTVHSYGASECFASVHCEVSAHQDIMISHDIIDNIERDFLKDMGIHLVIHLDPIITDDERTNELKAVVEELLAKVSPNISMHDFRVVWSVTHSNLIFDLVVPFHFKWSDGVLAEKVSEMIHNINESYYSVITIDHDYIPNTV